MEQNEIMEWLLDEENPSVRYFTLTQLLSVSPEAPEAVKARQAIMKSPTIMQLLSSQNPDGSWGESETFYTDKYEGTVWNLLILAELGADGKDVRVKAAVEWILEHCQDRDSGGFSYQKSARTGNGLASGVIPCLTGNMVFSLIRLGYLHDPRVQKGIAWILRYQRTDDGIKKTPQEEEYKRISSCFGNHSCHMGVAKALKALVAIPLEERSVEVKAKIAELADYFLIHHIYKKSHNLSEEAKPGWKKLGFPLMYNTDILEMLHLFTQIPQNDLRLHDALTVLKDNEKQGRWNLENTFNGKTRVSIEKKDQPSKWLTLKALTVFKSLGH